MESLEQRRQRLASMREQAAAQTTSEGAGDATSRGLSRPDFVTYPANVALPSDPLESFLAAGSTPDPSVSTTAAIGLRFGFYTDPLAGFSGFKRKWSTSPAVVVPATSVSATMPQNRSDSYRAVPFPTAPQFQAGSVFTPSTPPPWQPIPYQPPPYSIPPPAAPYFPQSQMPPFPQLHPQSAGQSPEQMFGRGRGTGRDGERVGGKGFPGGPPMGRGFPSPGRTGGGYSGHNVALGRRGHPGRSSSPRGGGSSSFTGFRIGVNDRNTGGGRGGGRGAKSAKEQPHLFYKKSMVEDPWQHLEATK